MILASHGDAKSGAQLPLLLVVHTKLTVLLSIESVGCRKDHYNNVNFLSDTTAVIDILTPGTVVSISTLQWIASLTELLFTAGSYS